MVTPKVMEAWLRLISEAMRGTADAQEAVKLLSGASASPEEMTRWMTRFMPAGVGGTKPEVFSEWNETWWRTMGFVPRSRYLELLEKYEMLRSRLEKSEETIRKLEPMLNTTKEQGEEAKKVLNLWETMLKDTLNTQAEWMRTWQDVSLGTKATTTEETKDKAVDDNEVKDEDSSS